MSGVKIIGEITVGTSAPPMGHRVVPRIIGADNVEAFKRSLGVCLVNGCRKQQGHRGECTPDQ